MPSVEGADVEAALQPLAQARRFVLPSEAGALLARYVGALERWNRSINLTGIKQPERIVAELVADAVPLVPHLPARPFRLIDVGSGAGLPGIVLAILRPDAQVLLLEPSQKRLAFLRAVRRELPLPNVAARGERLEALAADERFDVWVSRAVWPVGEWVTRASRLADAGATVLGQTGDEVPAVPGCVVEAYELAGARRHVVVRRGSA